MVLQSNHRPERLFFPVFLLLCLSGSILSQIVPSEARDAGWGGNNSIVGTVLSPSGQRVETRIKIRLVTMVRGDTTTVTDERGNFSFRGIPSGNYTIVIDKEKEYESLTQQVDIIQFRGSPPQVYTLNIRLSLKGQAKTKPGILNSELADVPKIALNLYNKAAELAKKGDHKGAIEQLRLSISEYPDFMLAFNELGLQYLRLNEVEKADESFQLALKIKPEAFAPLMNRGIVLVHIKRFEEAESMLRNALKTKTQSAIGHYFLGQTLANLGRFDEAEKEFVSAIALGGDEMKEAHRFLAIIYNARRDKERALVELETYLRLVPKTPDAEQLRKVIRQLNGLKAPSPTPTPSPETKPSP